MHSDDAEDDRANSGPKHGLHDRLLDFRRCDRCLAHAMGSWSPRRWCARTICVRALKARKSYARKPEEATGLLRGRHGTSDAAPALRKENVMRVDEIMARSVVPIDRSDSIDHARSLMAQYGIHHLPVFDHKRLVGILSTTDLAARGPEGTTVGEMMTEPVVTLAPDVSVREAAALMDRRHLRCIPVMEQDRIVGMVTESDLLRLVAARRGAPLSGLRLWLAWTFITIAGQVAAIAAVALLQSLVEALTAGHAHGGLVVVIGATSEGALVALVQTFVLRRAVPDISRALWVVAGGAGAAIAWLAGLFTAGAFGTGGVLAVILSGMVAGLIIGGAQWVVLRRRVVRAALWIPANAVAWILGLWVIIAGGVWQANAVEWMVATVGILTALGTGLAVGAVTGLALTQMRPTTTLSDRGR
jgi:acetoin utilization protein AcuB